MATTMVPQSYITDKGTMFTSEEYLEHLSQLIQITVPSAPGHHANGIAIDESATAYVWY